MDETNTQINTEGAPKSGVAVSAPKERDTRNFRGGRPGGRPGGGRGFDRPKPEFDQKILAIRRVTRVVAGGRRMSFSVAIAIGDKKGSVGLGTGKATDTSLAIGKALKAAKKNMIKLKLTKTMSLPHDVSAKFSSSSVMLFPNHGRGMVAGSSVRDLLILAGVRDVSSKVLSGSKNKLNNGKAALKALALLGTPRTPLAVAVETTEAFVIPEALVENK